MLMRKGRWLHHRQSLRIRDVLRLRRERTVEREHVALAEDLIQRYLPYLRHRARPERLYAITSIPNAIPIVATAVPMRPGPMIPRVFPASSMSGASAKLKSGQDDHRPSRTALV